jgi:hypothetical protein
VKPHPYVAVLPVFGYAFYAFFDRKSFIRHEGVDEFLSEGCQGHAWLHDNFRGVISIQSDGRHNTAQIAGIIAHESTHIWQHICTLIGEAKASEEMEAYHIQYITETVMGWYADYMKKTNKKAKKTK